MSLTAKQEAFAVAVAKGATGADAYRAAYDVGRMTSETLHKRVGELMKHGGIAGRIEALRAPALAKAGLSVERTLQEVGHISHVDPRRFYREDGTMKPPSEWDDAMAAAVSSVEAIPVALAPKAGESEGRIGYNYKIKFWDKNAGLEKSMKHLGLFERDNAQGRDSLVLRIEAARPVTR